MRWNPDRRSPQPVGAPQLPAAQFSITEATDLYEPARDPFALMDRDPAVVYTTVAA
ncbi:hypothetical protein ABIB25_003060 [Nakamurella sp. UYEF19]|uniref:hypothetical protein n=1 Tax=Nakamurella sp. UYEF19 TaxID=1756392 RepID=UPI0033934BA6